MAHLSDSQSVREKEDELEGVFNPPLGTDRGRRLLYRRSMDAAWTAALLVLFFLELSTRKVEIAVIAPVANGPWMSQIGRNLTDAVDGILTGKRYLIHDRDPLFTSEFLNLLAESGWNRLGCRRAHQT